MPNPFAQVEQKYHDLYQAYQQGDLDGERFAQELSSLQIQDDEDRWWQIQGNGGWLRFNQATDSWEEAVPPRPLPPPPPRSALAPPPRPAPAEPDPADAIVLEPDDAVLYASGSTSLALPTRPDLAELLNGPAAQPLPVEVTALPLQRPPARPVSVCSGCGLALPPQARFCGSCGQAVQATRCPQCHQALPDGAHFCNHCGHHLER